MIEEITKEGVIVVSAESVHANLGMDWEDTEQEAAAIRIAEAMEGILNALGAGDAAETAIRAVLERERASGANDTVFVESVEDMLNHLRQEGF